MAEQLALEQRLGQPGGVHRDERLAATRREVVNPPRHQLLAGPGLAFDQHGRRHGRHLLDLHQHFLDRRRFAEDTGALLQVPPLDEPPHRRGDFGRIGGLHEPRRQPQLPADLAGIFVRRLDQAERRDGVLARGGQEALCGGLVQATAQNNRIRLPTPGSRLPSFHGMTHVVERGDHRGVEARLLQARIDPDGLLQVIRGNEDSVSHEKRFQVSGAWCQRR